MGKTIITTTCYGCKKPFQKLLSEYNRRRKMGKNQFCSTECANEYNHNRVDWKELHSVKIKTDSTFHYLLRCILRRKIGKKQTCDVDVPYLKQVWKKQQGICPYTGIKMVFPTHWAEMARTHSLERVSLDRIDSSKGYTKGNVEFVCMGVNYAKNRWTKEMTIQFFEKIRNNSPPTK